MKPDRNINGIWELRGYSDVDYAVDNDTCKSVTWYIVLINRAFIAWCLQSHKTVTISVIEDAYSSITEVCCEILILCVVLLFMGIFVEYPITVHIDDVGAILILENTLVSQQTKQINARHHFIYDYVKYLTVEFNFYVQMKTYQIHLQRT